MILLEFEKEILNNRRGVTVELSDAAINEKYEKGEARIITEQGAVKLSLVKGVFNGDNYQLKPKYQRRITWDSKKRSKLIESFIMNVPVPPVFVYETEFNKYQVMDGLQRITAIIDFYSDSYELQDLTQWPELNGRKYSNLPQKIKEGIDRRQLPVITLLKESSKTLLQEEEMKKMVFERLNTGGVTLEDQEIRNALYSGTFNDLCIELSSNDSFRKLWLITPSVDEDADAEELDNYDDALKYAKNKLYKRMYDVELVLRYFAMRHIDEFSGKLSEFMDLVLRDGNRYSDEQCQLMKNIFETTIAKADKLFSEKAFCQYTKIRGTYIWTLPQKMVYDPLMLALSQIGELPEIDFDIDKNIKELESFYRENEAEFDGKRQSKSDIKHRMELFEAFIKKLIG
ncbi:MAG: DUF262 domain-containing protein [Aminipila sp.]